jgi:hypothetical protein
VPATRPTPRRLPGPPPEDPWPAGDSGPDDPDDIIAWLDAELAKAAPWLADDPDWDDGEPPGPTPSAEVLKAGRWDRTRGDGSGFAAGGLADLLPPGPVLAGLAGDRWRTGLDKLSDDELIGVLRAARRLTSWAAAMELAAAGDLWRRRTADEDAGETGAALHADAELAAALTLTRRSADHLLTLAVELGRLPATAAALAAGTIDLPRAEVIAAEVTGLTDEHAAAVEAAIITAAPRQTTGQLRRAAHRAVLAADPTAAQRRKEQALREARVERWSEPAGTAALAGRDLPPAAVLAADANLTALAKQLKAAGGVGTLDTLRAQIYLALLTGAPVSSLLPASAGETCPPSTDPADTSGPPGAGPTATGSPTTSSLGTASAAQAIRPSDAGALRVTGRVNLTVPLATWLGHSDTPGHAAGYGPLDATDIRTLADALAAQPGARWCLTFIGPDGRPAAHGCARTGPPTEPDNTASTDRTGKPAPGRRAGASTRTGHRPTTGSSDRPGTSARPPPWTFTLTPLTSGDCDHAWETPAYQPTAGLRHLVQLRHATCVFPTCGRPAAQCDDDHTLPYDDGGKTCLCNLAPVSLLESIMWQRWMCMCTGARARAMRRSPSSWN